MNKPLVIIEHLEPILTKWVYLEYRHVSMLVGRDHLIITNVTDEKARNELNELGRVYKKSIRILIDEIEHDKAIILEPQATRRLEPNDFDTSEIIVIVGGIMGDNPPKGRTWKLLTSELMGRAIPRSLGPRQLSVDGAVYVALQIASGRKLDEIPLTENIEVEVTSPFPGMKNIVVLPFAYPLINGKPLLAPGLVEYLKHEIVLDEDEIIRKFMVE